jgi:hypothetical protein
MKGHLFTTLSSLPLRTRVAACLIVLIVGSSILQWFIPVRRDVPLIVDYLVQFLMLGYCLWTLRAHKEAGTARGRAKGGGVAAGGDDE